MTNESLPLFLPYQRKHLVYLLPKVHEQDLPSHMYKRFIESDQELYYMCLMIIVQGFLYCSKVTSWTPICNSTILPKSLEVEYNMCLKKLYPMLKIQFPFQVERFVFHFFERIFLSDPSRCHKHCAYKEP